MHVNNKGQTGQQSCRQCIYRPLQTLWVPHFASHREFTHAKDLLSLQNFMSVHMHIFTVEVLQLSCLKFQRTPADLYKSKLMAISTPSHSCYSDFMSVGTARSPMRASRPDLACCMYPLIRLRFMVSASNSTMLTKLITCISVCLKLSGTACCPLLGALPAPGCEAPPLACGRSTDASCISASAVAFCVCVLGERGPARNATGISILDDFDSRQSNGAFHMIQTKPTLSVTWIWRPD